MTGPAARRPIAVIAITRRGAQMAAVLAGRVRGVEVYVDRRWASEVPGPCRAFSLPLRPLVRDVFGRYPSLVLFVAVGVAVRLVGPLLSGKDRDPAVVTLDEAGRFAVCLLSGHRGGGESLAREVAAALGATPVVTSASAALGLPALDLLGSERGWRLEGAEHVAPVSAALINGGPVGFYQDAGERPWDEAPPGVKEMPSLDEALGSGLPCIVVSDRALPPRPLAGPVLLYRPPTLVAGVGCRRGVSGQEVASFVLRVLSENGLAPASLRCLATIADKAGEPGLQEAATVLGVPLEAVPAETVQRLASLVSPSASERLLGLPSVSEASALAVAGASRLVVPRAKNGRVTVAVARMEAQA